MSNCIFCKAQVSVRGHIDIGGLVLCVSCYRTRKARTFLPCAICEKPAAIAPDPLIVSRICRECDAGADLAGAYHRAGKAPCDLCKLRTGEYPTTYGQNLCYECYKHRDCPCTQMYSGDRGYPPFASKPSVPAVVLPVGTETSCKCVVCGVCLLDPTELVEEMKVPPLCSSCTGPKWWKFKQDNYKCSSEAPAQAEVDTPIILDNFYADP